MAKTPHDVHMRETGMKSFSGSNGIGCRWRGMQSIAVVVVQGMHGQPDLRVPLIHELPDSWKINVPDSVDANKLRQNLQDHLTAIGQMSTEWPSDENQAYRTVAHHILMAVLDVPVPAK